MSMMRSGLTSVVLATVVVAGLGACSKMSNMMGGGAAQHGTATAPSVAPDMIRQVQSKLRDGGYYKQGAVDGVWGTETETAVKSFQRDHSLTNSGQLDLPTLQALNVTGAAPAAMTSSTPASTTVGTPATTTVTPAQPMAADPDARPGDSMSTSTPTPAH